MCRTGSPSRDIAVRSVSDVVVSSTNVGISTVLGPGGAIDSVPSQASLGKGRLPSTVNPRFPGDLFDNAGSGITHVEYLQARISKFHERLPSLADHATSRQPASRTSSSRREKAGAFERTGEYTFGLALLRSSVGASGNRVQAAFASVRVPSIDQSSSATCSEGHGAPLGSQCFPRRSQKANQGHGATARPGCPFFVPTAHNSETLDSRLPPLSVPL